MFFSVCSLFWLLRAGILTSNVVAGFVASFTAKNKENYIINRGVSGIGSSFTTLLMGILLQGTPMGFSSWNTLGILSLGLSIGGAGFVLGIIGAYVGNWLQK